QGRAVARMQRRGEGRRAGLPRQPAPHPPRTASDAMKQPILRALLATACGLCTLGAAFADSGRAMPRTVPTAYPQECASCHVAYPPGMLPARSWQRLMSGLDHHYGTDASIDAATVTQLSTWLQAHAADGQRAAQEPPQDRITRAAWFERK